MPAGERDGKPHSSTARILLILRIRSSRCRSMRGVAQNVIRRGRRQSSPQRPRRRSACCGTRGRGRVPPMPTCGLRKRMPLATSLSAAKCISVSPVPARTAAILPASSAPQPRMMMRPAACFTSAASSVAPSTAVSRWPLVSTRPTPAADQRLQRLGGIARHVEGAVAGDGERPGRLDQRAHPRLVDGAVGRQAADDDAGDAEVAQGRDVVDHRGELGVRIEEIAAARPHDHMERNLRQPQRLAHRAEARRDAAFDQAGAELDAVGARLLARPAARRSPRRRSRSAAVSRFSRPSLLLRFCPRVFDATGKPCQDNAPSGSVLRDIRYCTGMFSLKIRRGSTNFLVR